MDSLSRKLHMKFWLFLLPKSHLCIRSLILLLRFSVSIVIVELVNGFQNTALNNNWLFTNVISYGYMNGDGLAFSGTTVSSREAHYGLPKPFIGRTILHTFDNVTGATEYLQKISRTTGGNPLLADARGGLRVLECSSVKCVVLHPDKGYVGTMSIPLVT